MPYGITQCYLPPGRGDIPAFTTAKAATRFSNPGGMQGWVDPGGWLEMVYPHNGHPSWTNRAQCWLSYATNDANHYTKPPPQVADMHDLAAKILEIFLRQHRWTAVAGNTDRPLWQLDMKGRPLSHPPDHPFAPMTRPIAVTHVYTPGTVVVGRCSGRNQLKKNWNDC